MSKITLKGNEINTAGELPSIGSEAPLFTLTGPDLGTIAASDYKGSSSPIQYKNIGNIL